MLAGYIIPLYCVVSSYISWSRSGRNLQPTSLRGVRPVSYIKLSVRFTNLNVSLIYICVCVCVCGGGQLKRKKYIHGMKPGSLSCKLGIQVRVM